VGCIAEVNNTLSVKPTGYVYVVISLIPAALAIVLIHMIHSETEFTPGGAGATPASHVSDVPAASSSRQMQILNTPSAPTAV
jgi:hypothetical protein